MIFVGSYLMSEKSFFLHWLQEFVFFRSDALPMANLAKTINNFDQGKWNEVACGFMKTGVFAKFEQNPRLNC